MKRIILSVLCLVATATAAFAQTADQKKATVAYLESLQNADGGFLFQSKARDDTKPSSLAATSTAVRALR